MAAAAAAAAAALLLLLLVTTTAAFENFSIGSRSGVITDNFGQRALALDLGKGAKIPRHDWLCGCQRA